MDQLHAMRVFTRVVEMSSFSRAADALNIPHATTSTIIKHLEAHLHVQLLQRTTRRLNVTPEGAEYYAHCLRVLADIDQTENALANNGKGPRGTLRLDMPVSIGRMLVMPRLWEFQERYPDIELVVGFNDKPVDLMQDGVDCAIRLGPLEDSGLVARRLAQLTIVTAAAPAYLSRAGSPQTLEALSQHRAVHYFSSLSGRVRDMHFALDGKTVDIKTRPAIAVNDADAYLMAGLKGAGLIQTFEFMVQPHLHSGALVEILPQHRPPAVPLSVVYPRNRHLPQKVQVFVEWAVTLFKRCPLRSAEDIEVSGRTACIDRAGIPTSETDASDRTRAHPSCCASAPRSPSRPSISTDRPRQP